METVAVLNSQLDVVTKKLAKSVESVENLTLAHRVEVEAITNAMNNEMNTATAMTAIVDVMTCEVSALKEKIRAVQG